MYARKLDKADSVAGGKAGDVTWRGGGRGGKLRGKCETRGAHDSQWWQLASTSASRGSLCVVVAGSADMFTS